MALGVMSPRGTSLADQQKARAYLKKPDVNASHTVATPPGKRGFLKELSASTARGYAAYDKTAVLQVGYEPEPSEVSNKTFVC